LPQSAGALVGLASQKQSSKPNSDVCSNFRTSSPTAQM